MMERDFQQANFSRRLVRNSFSTLLAKQKIELSCTVMLSPLIYILNVHTINLQKKKKKKKVEKEMRFLVHLMFLYNFTNLLYLSKTQFNAQLRRA